MVHVLKYGVRKIKYKINRTDRKTLAINVYPDLDVLITAPRTKRIDDIKKRVNKRASWILKQLAHFESLPPEQPARKYVSGETHRYLGKQYRIKVKGHKEKNDVKLKGGWIEISLKGRPQKKRVKDLLINWYRSHAKDRFRSYLDECYKKVKKFGIEYPKLFIRTFEKRWGSCSKKGHIYLNLNLIKQSPLCIQYVIMHELCHLKYHNHSRSFFMLMSKIMPDWETRKKKLELSEV